MTHTLNTPAPWEGLCLPPAHILGRRQTLLCLRQEELQLGTPIQGTLGNACSRGTYGGLSHFLCRKRAPVPHVRLHMLHAPQGLQSPSTCSGMGVLLTHSPARHH